MILLVCFFSPNVEHVRHKVPDMDPDILRQAMALGPVGKSELTHQARLGCLVDLSILNEHYIVHTAVVVIEPCHVMSTAS